MISISYRSLLWNGTRRQLLTVVAVHRTFTTSKNGADGSEYDTAKASEDQVKIVPEVKKKRGASAQRVATDENLKSDNIRRKLIELKKKKEWREPKPRHVTTVEILTAVDSVVKDLHHDDITSQRRTKNELIEKLKEYEKEKFEAATSVQYSEMLSDKVFANLLAELKEETVRPPPRAIEMRRIRRGLLLLKREIFYQAMQSGHKAEDARRIAERAVKIAEERAVKKHEMLTQNYTEEKRKEMMKEMEQTDKENSFYNVALQMASKMLYPDDRTSDAPHLMLSNVVHPDIRVISIFENRANRLNIFKAADIPKLKYHFVKQWVDWDRNAATIWNQSFGPRNAFEEMIELTEQGKMWPYPIDNEYQIGEEGNVGFYEHVFLERYLAQYDLPKEGPIAQFMELVCIGLSKNPYMTIKKKHAHLDWFANYFKEKTEEIKRIQETAGLPIEGSI